MNRFTENKPPFHYTVGEWFDHNKQQFVMTRDRGICAEKVLEQSDRIRERTKEMILKKKNETEWKFKERIKDIEFMRIELERVRSSIQEELEAMGLTQKRIEDEIKYVNVNALEIVQKCIQFRKGRYGIDLIHDEVERELEKEEKKIKESEKLLQKTLEESIGTRRELRASLYSLNKDVERKLNCLAIETECLDLRETNLDLNVYQGDKQLDNSTITPHEWRRFSQEIISLSNKKIHSARIFQCHVYNILEEVVQDLREQCNKVNEAFQRRIQEVKDAKIRLEKQHYELARQIYDMNRNISELEKSIQEKEGFLALAQTRLEKRSNRPGVELVKDEVEASLVVEVLEIKQSVSELQHMLSEAQATLRYLSKAQVKIEEDLNVKTNSIKIDEVDCMIIRQGINYQAY